MSAHEHTARATPPAPILLPATSAPPLVKPEPLTLPPTRAKFAGFVADDMTAQVLKETLAPALPIDGHIHVVNFRTSLTILSRMACPHILLVDISGEVQPLTAMMELADLVEPGTQVLLVGEARELSFYRAVVNGMGVKEYLAKPLTHDAVSRHFLRTIQVAPKENLRPSQGGKGLESGQVISFAGARGGIGTTTIAANLAWIIGHEMHRHAVLLDTDLHTGTAALALNIEPSPGIAAALAAPERLDGMLIERVVQSAGNRLHVIAGLEELGNFFQASPNAAMTLSKNLRQRYKFTIVDAGAKHMPFARDMLEVSEKKVVIMDPSIISIRNFERLSASQGWQDGSLLVLNMAGRAYGLSQSFMEQSLGKKFDAVIPDLPRILPKATHYGEMAASIRGPFREAIVKLAKCLGAGLKEPAAKTPAKRMSLAG